VDIAPINTEEEVTIGEQDLQDFDRDHHRREEAGRGAIQTGTAMMGPGHENGHMSMRNIPEQEGHVTRWKVTGTAQLNRVVDNGRTEAIGARGPAIAPDKNPEN
jgi:hypothetical protein